MLFILFSLSQDLLTGFWGFGVLGIVLDEFLSWAPHVKMISTKISRTLGIIKRVRHFLPFKGLKCLYNALIVPHLNYGLKLWGTNLKAIFLLQKKAIRVITHILQNFLPLTPAVQEI